MTKLFFEMAPRFNYTCFPIAIRGFDKDQNLWIIVLQGIKLSEEIAMTSIDN
jgi:hypothetical protein